MTNTTNIPDHEFNVFIQDMIAKDGLEATLTGLKDRLGVNINILLFCCWFALTGKKQLHKKDLQEMISAIETWNERIIKPLKNLRATIDAQSSKKIRDLLNKVVVNEQLAEKIERLMLADRMIRPQYRRSLQQKFNDVCRNMAAYFKELQITLTEHDANSMKQIVLHLFPDINPEHVKDTWNTAPISKQQPEQYNQPEIAELI